MWRVSPIEKDADAVLILLDEIQEFVVFNKISFVEIKPTSFLLAFTRAPLPVILYPQTFVTTQFAGALQTTTLCDKA